MENHSLHLAEDFYTVSSLFSWQESVFSQGHQVSMQTTEYICLTIQKLQKLLKLDKRKKRRNVPWCILVDHWRACSGHTSWAKLVKISEDQEFETTFWKREIKSNHWILSKHFTGKSVLCNNLAEKTSMNTYKEGSINILK